MSKKATAGKPSKAPSLQQETIAIDKLKAHPRNYRKHPEDQIAHIAESIRRNGVYRPVVIAKDNTILAGHGVVEALRGMKKKEVPCVRLSISPNSPQALKLLTGDNEIGDRAEDDERILTDMLKEIAAIDDESLLGTGFDMDMLSGLVYATRKDDEIPDADAAAAWAELDTYDTGKKLPKLIITFDNEKDRETFCRKYGMRVKRNLGLSWSSSWPDSEDMDNASVKIIPKTEKTQEASENKAPEKRKRKG